MPPGAQAQAEQQRRGIRAAEPRARQIERQRGFARGQIFCGKRRPGTLQRSAAPRAIGLADPGQRDAHQLAIARDKALVDLPRLAGKPRRLGTVGQHRFEPGRHGIGRGQLGDKSRGRALRCGKKFYAHELS